MIFVGRLLGAGGSKVEATTAVVRSVDEAMAVIRKGESTLCLFTHFLSWCC